MSGLLAPPSHSELIISYLLLKPQYDDFKFYLQFINLTLCKYLNDEASMQTFNDLSLSMPLGLLYAVSNWAI